MHILILQMYHICVLGDILKYRQGNELQLFCTRIIQKLRHLKERPTLCHLPVIKLGDPRPPFLMT